MNVAATSAHKASPEVKSLGDLLDGPRITREDMLGVWLKERHLVLLYAPSGVGKSYLAMSAALAVAGGGNLASWAASKPRRVLAVDGEMDTPDLQERADQLLKLLPGVDVELARKNLLFLARLDQKPGVDFPDVATPEGRQRVLEVATQHRAELVILDNLSTLASIEEENEASSFNAIIELLVELKTRGKAVLLVHHSRKASSGENAYRGSQKLSVIFNAILRLEYPAGGPSTVGAGFTLHWEKFRAQRDETTRAPLMMTLRETGWVAEVDEDARMTQAVEALRSLKYISLREMEAGIGIPKSTLFRLLKRAVTIGVMTTSQTQKWWDDAKELRKVDEQGLVFEDVSEDAEDDF